MEDKKIHNWVKPVIDALLVSAVVALVMYAGILDVFNRSASDMLYQKEEKSPSPDIFVIGIDEKTLDKYGKLCYWERRGMAKVIEYLNKDPKSRPAVIGVDTLFTGKNPYDEEEDKLLAEAANRYKNVVFAAEAQWDGDDENNVPYSDYLDKPYEGLTGINHIGNVWTPDEKDGIIRHGLLNVKVNGMQGELLNFSRVIYNMWCDYNKKPKNPPPPCDERGLFYLPFSRLQFNEDVNIIDLLDGKVKPEQYKGKMVLIGLRATAMGDDFKVALNHQFIYGIDIHANEIQAYQRNFFPREANNTVQLVLLLLAVFFAELFFQRSKMQNVIIAMFLILFGWIGICYCFYNYFEILLHTLYIPLFTGFLFIGSVTRNYFRARDEKIILGRYFDPVIMKEIIKNNSDALRLGGSKGEIAVLFADIRSFTVMSEKFKTNTEAVVDILNRYLDMTTRCVRKYHGTLDKFVGDQIMAFWNAPIEQENAVFLACHAALDMVSELDGLQSEIKEKYDWELTFGIGIHWGEAVVGNIGSSYRMDYTAIGDTVNTAARLEANAGGGEIYISREVANILGDSAKTETLSTPIKLKGKGDSVEVLKLVSLEDKNIG
ncbi:MAG: adenylate/guanylate cyclase domain-containing protein [Selenomonadaceae bacterium]|nr:adenylate/guanylate cyclase domain-containing protein [Selenomonadaceae bacterium]